MQFFQHGFRLLRHLVIPNPDDCYALRLKIGCAFPVPAFSVGLVMLPPVHLNRYSGFVTVKIQHIGRNWVLAAEFQPAELPVSEQVPKQVLGAGLAFAEIASEGHESGRESRLAFSSLTRPSATLSRGERVFRGLHVALFTLSTPISPIGRRGFGNILTALDYCLAIFAQVSRSGTVRLKTKRSGVVSGSAQK